MLLTQYGPGDPATWGAIVSGVDPRSRDLNDEEINAIYQSKLGRVTEEDWQAEAEAVVAEAEARGDEALLQRIAAAAVTGPLAFDLLMKPICEKRLERRCWEDTLAEFDKVCKESEEDYYRRRVEG